MSYFILQTINFRRGRRY